jgi:hypothetical protein
MIRRLRVRSLFRRDGGSVTLPIMYMIGGILIIIGVAYDGGGLFDDTQRANFLAQEAARAGAQQIDVGQYLATGRAVIDKAKATDAATSYLTNIKDLAIYPNSIHVYFGAGGSAIQVTFKVQRNVVFLTGSGWGIDKTYGNAVVVLRQGVTDAGG